MKLDVRLAEVAPADRDRFLFQKYREIRLIDRLDRLTDRNLRLPSLMIRALRIIRRFFGCQVAAFALADSARRRDQGFFVAGVPDDRDDPQRIALREQMARFLSEPTPHLTLPSTDGELAAAGIRNCLLMPMIVTSQLEGAFLIANRERDFNEIDRYFLGVVSHQLDNAVIHCHLREEHQSNINSLKQRVRELNTLYEMSLSLTYGTDFETMAGKVIQSSMHLVGADRASLMLYESATDELKTVLVVGEKQKLRLVKLGSGRGIAGLALAAGKPVLAQHGADDERFVPFDFSGIKPRKIHSLVSIPLMAGDKPLGVINFVMLSRRKAFNHQDSETLSVAAHLVSLACQRQQFYQMSIKDELTGLYTFRYFSERLTEEINRTRRYRMAFSLVLFDLDHFKAINDTHGHPCGNVVLKAVAQVLANAVRKGVDIPVRYGGEELALILPHTNERGAYILAERIRLKIEGLDLTHEGHPVRVTISGGIAGFPTHGDAPQALIAKADQALYRAKAGGRNRIEIAD